MNRIKQLREEKKWTQLELSQKMNCAMSSIAMYENETRNPSLEVLVKLSEIFNCSIDYILGKSEIRNPEEKDSNEVHTPQARAIARGFDKLPPDKQKIYTELLNTLLDTKDENN